MIGADKHKNNTIREQKTVLRNDITVLIKTRSGLTFVKLAIFSFTVTGNRGKILILSSWKAYQY